MAKRASDPVSPGIKKPAGKRPVGGGATVPPHGGIPARLAELGYDPIAIIADIAMDESADTRLRFSVAKELAAYLLTKPRETPVEPTGNVDVAEIIAGTWRLPAEGKGGEARPAARKRPSRKASGADTGAGR